MNTEIQQQYNKEDTSSLPNSKDKLPESQMAQTALSPHILIFPCPVMGHVNSMLKLAELLCLADLHVSFVVTSYIHGRLRRFTDVQSRFEDYPGFRFEVIPHDDALEELPHSRTVIGLYEHLDSTSKPFIKQLVGSNNQNSDGARRPVTCIITDGLFGLGFEAAQDAGIPIIYFRTASACSFWACFCIPNLIEAGVIPFTGSDMDEPVTHLPGMEGFLRRRDLPSLCRAGDPSDVNVQLVARETQKTAQARALILNTFEDLEGPILSHIRTQCPNLYAIGPLHAQVKNRLAAKAASRSTSSSNGLWEEDRSCIRWLDEQASKSVLYVSFGSIAVMTRDQHLELWHGLVNSGKRFLWVTRPGLVAEKDGEGGQIPADILEGTKERGCLVGWAPQEEVLAHPAIGGFLTHSGWNSTLESIVEGVPMICWPFFADQQLNSRYVGEIWKLGMDMKDTCDRAIVEKMVKDLMEVRKDELQRSADEMAELAKRAVSEGGSSYCCLDRLIHVLGLMA